MRNFCRGLLITLLIPAALAFGQQVVQVAGRSRGTSNTSMVSIAALTNYKNCLKHLSVSTTEAGNLHVLAGGTTIYTVALGAGGGIVEDWDEADAPCTTSVNTAMYVYLTTSTAYRMSYSAFAY